MLNINLLGEFKIQYNNYDITDKIGSKTTALIALLMLHEKRDISREKVIAYLWPDSNEDAAKYNLRYNMWLLKKVIPIDENGESFLKINKEFCGINFNYNFTCDILSIFSFNDYNEYSVSTLIKLKEQFSGDFLEGIYFNNCDEFNDVIIYERNKLENYKIKILTNIVEVYEKNAMYEQAIETTSEIFNIDPYNEKLALRVMLLYISNGNRYAAMNFYKEFSKRMVYCLGIHPSRELQEKYDEIINDSSYYGEIESSGDKQIISQIEDDGNESKVRLNIKGIKIIDHFSIAEIIEKLIEEDALNKLSNLDEEYLGDLAYISQPLAKKCELNIYEKIVVPDVRIARAFIELIHLVNKKYYIEIAFKNIEELDNKSKEILMYLYNENLIKILDCPEGK